MKTSSTLFPAALAVALLTIPVLAQQSRAGAGDRSKGGERSGRRGGNRSSMLMRALTNPKLAEELGISEEQVEKLKAKLSEIAEEEIDLKAELRKKMLRQTQMLADTEASPKAILELVEESGDVRTELAKLNVSKLLAAREILTPEQIEKARDVLMARSRRMREEHEGRRREQPRGHDEARPETPQRPRPDPAVE